MPYDRLTSLDASFLHLERIETPMHVGALTVLEGDTFFGPDGRFRLRDVRDLVSSRLHLIPRFRKRIMRVPLDAGDPIWVDDERFDIGYHVRLTALPAPGTRDQLLALFERVQSQVLDRTRPLWELWFVEGLEGGHVALFQKTHHALVDGVSGVDVATVLFDFEPEPTFLDAPEWEPQPAPPPARLLIDSVKEMVAGPQALVEATRKVVEVPRRALDKAGELARSLSTLAEGGLVAPKTSLNNPVEGRSRRFGLVQVSLDDVKVVREAFGGTINDVVLAGIGGGLARLLESREELYPELVLKIFCPVSVRDESQKMQLGNRISAMFIPLSVGEPDAVNRLRGVQQTTHGLKEREQALGAATLLELTQYAAPTIMGLAARLVHHQPLTNLVCTNVPGPQTPLYCLGGRMLEAYPMVPLARNLNLGIAILSYCGTLHLGLLADRDQWHDLDILEAGIDESFAELTKLARERGAHPVSEVWERDAHEIADAVRAGNLSAREVVDAHLTRIEKLDPDLNSVCYLDASGARERADAIDAEVRDGGDPGPLAGVPVGVKELASVGGWPETHASVVLADRVAVTDDNEVARLRGAGAVITGLTTASEHGTVSFTNTPLHGITRNPWNLERTPGGSSGGSAAAVAAGLFPACTGGDGGGSIRIPSSYSGLFGMKGTFGRIGRGPGPFSSSLNPVRGPMVRSVHDAARYLDVTSGPTLTDPTSLPAPVVPFEEELRSGRAAERLRGKRVTFASSVGFAGADPVVAEHAEDLAHTLIDVAGLELVPDVDVSLPKPGMSWAVLSTIDDMSWFVDDVEGRLDEVTTVHKLQHLSFTKMTPQVLAKAIRRRHELLTVVAAIFEQVDLLLTPTTPTPAFAAEGVFASEVNGEEVGLFELSAPFCAPFNMTGQPAASIPSGLVDGLPVALQVVAPRHLDIDCLAAGALLEDARPWPKLAPFAYER